MSSSPSGRDTKILKEETNSWILYRESLHLKSGSSSINVYDPRHDKTCLREFPTTPDTNRPAQPQKLARVLKFRL